ncbi:MAG: fumarylacetoacetate hydrolase family protein, partial [Halomonas sp.]
HGIDFEGEIAVITDDVPMAVTPEEAAKHIKLVMLVNDVSLRGLIPGELAKGFGFFQAKPASSFSPIAVTPDELGDAWQEGKVHLPLTVHLNGEKFGEPEAGPDMIFSFPQLVAHAAKTRYLGAGAVIGSGTISNPDPDGGPGKPVADGGVGYSCLAEVRMVEQILHGQVKTPFMRFGDRVRIEMFDRDGHNIFGTIDQQVVKYQPK